jgi:Primase C terminal 2 (PriCT-2)/Family of unknown function (DUF5906)
LLAAIQAYYDCRAGATKLDPPTDQAPDMELIKAALNVIPSDDYETWFAVGGALHRALGEDGYALFEEWSQKSTNKFKQSECRYKWTSGLASVTDIGLGTIFWYANKAKPDWRTYYADGVGLEDFRAYMPQHNYIYIPTREPWPASSVNARIPPVPITDENGNAVLDQEGKPKTIKASTWLDQNRPVEQMTWAPGSPMEINNRLVSDGGWITKRGVSCFNLYRPPTIEPGDATKAGPWLEHVHKVFPGDAEHIIKWLAQRVQCPQDKINHALVLGSKKQGTGKDTALEPVKHAIGPWNFQEVSPQQVGGRFNGFLKKVILRVNEARDLGDVNRYQFYDHMKSYTAAPPDVLRVDEKNLREHSIFNCVGVILTTNHKTDGIYLPAEDRRHYVAWTDRTPEDFEEGYWNRLWRWYRDEGGNNHVAAYLRELDISTFDPKAPPPKTAAFWDIVEANRAPEDAELADVLDMLHNPPATTLSRIRRMADDSLNRWLSDRRNSRAIPYRLERCGYVAIRNETNDQGFWIVDLRRQVVYAKATLSVREQIEAASALSKEEPM